MQLPGPEINFNRGKLWSGIIYPEFFPFYKDEEVLNIGCGDGVQAVVYKGNFKKMIGININKDRLEASKKLMRFYGIENFKPINANVEDIPLEEKFDKIIAIDIIEHVINPQKVINEAGRLLKDEGMLMITFPAMHDKWENLFRFIGRRILKRKGKTLKKEGWDPDAHQYNFSLKEWDSLMQKGGFKFIRSRGSTLFPPLHYLGLPKFWFSSKFIHSIDNYLCKLPILKNFSHALVCVYNKRP